MAILGIIVNILGYFLVICLIILFAIIGSILFLPIGYDVVIEKYNNLSSEGTISLFCIITIKYEYEETNGWMDIRIFGISIKKIALGAMPTETNTDWDLSKLKKQPWHKEKSRAESTDIDKEENSPIDKKIDNEISNSENKEVDQEISKLENKEIDQEISKLKNKKIDQKICKPKNIDKEMSSFPNKKPDKEKSRFNNKEVNKKRYKFKNKEIKKEISKSKNKDINDDMSRSVLDWIKIIYDVWQQPQRPIFFREVFKLIKNIFNQIKPKYIFFNVCIGKDNAADTGELIAQLMILYPWLHKYGTVEGNYIQKGIWGDVEVKGSIRLYCFIKIIIKFAIKKEVREYVKIILDKGQVKTNGI
ncbi:MAG: hypothetical protein ACRCSG_03355 [Cellulosilyticaceae bacterium]